MKAIIWHKIADAYRYFENQHAPSKGSRDDGLSVAY